MGKAPGRQGRELGVLRGAAGRVCVCRAWRDLAGTGSWLVESQVLGTVRVSAQNSGRDALMCAAKLLQEETREGQGQSCV